MDELEAIVQLQDIACDLPSGGLSHADKHNPGAK